MVVEQAKQFSRVEVPAPNRLVVFSARSMPLARSVCQRPEQLRRFEQALARGDRPAVRVEFELIGRRQPTGAAARRRPARVRLRRTSGCWKSSQPSDGSHGPSELFGAQPSQRRSVEGRVA